MRLEMTKRVTFTDTGTATDSGYPIYATTFDGKPLGLTWRVFTTAGGWWAAITTDGIRAEGPNRGRAVAALLTKEYALGWREAFTAAGVK